MPDKQSILDHFGGDFTGFYSCYLPDLKRGKANCPFHECDSKSLSVDTKAGLFKCHYPGCGASGDIFRFYALKQGMNGDFPAVLEGIAKDFGISANGSKPHQEQPRKLVKRYAYMDADGNPSFYKNRFEPKTFSISRPNGSGGYISCLGDVEPILYNLPEVLDADLVFVVEGEKDADSLNGIGITATTNFDGAGKWRDSYTQDLKGKTVAIIPDDDEAGRKHAELVARNLSGKAAAVKILTLPNPAGVKGFDVSDWLALQSDQNESANQLLLMADTAPEWTPPAESEPATDTPSGFQFIHNADILADLKPIEWRIGDILTDHALYYNFGDPGHFKTFIELDRLLCIASGIDYHGHKVKQGTVFYICGEGWQGIGRRIAAWHIAHRTKAADVPFFVSRTPTQLMDLEAIQDVRRAVDAMAKQYGPPAIVHIDTLARNFGEGDENATKDMNKAISNLDKAFLNDLCRGLTHHTGHANKDRARGAMALHGAADGAFRISLNDSGQIVVECKKMKDAPTAPLMIFNRREVLLQIGDTEDRSYVVELTAEGAEAEVMVKPRKAAELKGNLKKALDILRNLHARFQQNLAKSGRSTATPQITYVEWRTACADAGLYKRTDSFKRAFESIHLAGYVELDESKRFVYLKDIIIENED